MDVSFLHYEIEKDKYSEYLNKLAEKDLIRYDYFEVALSECKRNKRATSIQAKVKICS
jgi:hypothetical protein